MPPIKTHSIPMSECRNGWVYRINSRNLSFGVFVTADNSFIGIRTKFGARFLDSEYHYDTGAPFGTVHPKEELEAAPPGLQLRTLGPLIDADTGRPVTDTRTEYPAPPAYIYADTGEPCTSKEIRWSKNQPLFDYMLQIEEKYRKPEPDAEPIETSKA